MSAPERMPVATAARLAREIEHHRQIAARAEQVWNWDSPAGRRRAARRAALFVGRGALEPGRRALEYGCGTGVFLERVARSGAQLVGLDLSPDLLARARTRLAGLDNVRLTRGNAEALPFPTASFDTVYGCSVLHHLDLATALREAWRVLRPGGRLVFSEPNLLNPQVALMFQCPPLKPHFAVSPDERAFTRFHARRALRVAGFEAVSVRPFDFLHPALPSAWLGTAERWTTRLENVPMLREIAGSMLLEARRP